MYSCYCLELTDSSMHVCMSSNPMDAILKLCAHAYSAQLSRITATGVCWPGLLSPKTVPLDPCPTENS